jgi:rubrerythrin
MNTLTVYPDGIAPVTFQIANGFVGRAVSAIAAENIPDAERTAKILNDHFAKITPTFWCPVCGQTSVADNDENGNPICAICPQSPQETNND